MNGQLLHALAQNCHPLLDGLPLKLKRLEIRLLHIHGLQQFEPDLLQSSLLASQLKSEPPVLQPSKGRARDHPVSGARKYLHQLSIGGRHDFRPALRRGDA